MTTSLKDTIQALNHLVKQGKVWAKCPKCNIPLSNKEYSKLRCDTCGKISLRGKNPVTFHPKVNIC